MKFHIFGYDFWVLKNAVKVEVINLPWRKTIQFLNIHLASYIRNGSKHSMEIFIRRSLEYCEFGFNSRLKNISTNIQTEVVSNTFEKEFAIFVLENCWNLQTPSSYTTLKAVINALIIFKHWYTTKSFPFAYNVDP